MHECPDGWLGILTAQEIDESKSLLLTGPCSKTRQACLVTPRLVAPARWQMPVPLIHTFIAPPLLGNERFGYCTCTGPANQSPVCMTHESENNVLAQRGVI